MDLAPSSDPAVQALCLAARTSPSDQATTALRSLGPDVDWDRLAALGHLHEVLPLLARSVPAAFDGSDDVPPRAWVDAASRRRHATARRNGELAVQLQRVLAAFDAAGIEIAPVKGLVIAAWAYGDLAARPAADVDVLVRTADLPPARRILRDLGFRQTSAPSFTNLTHEFHDPPWFLGDGPGQVTLELHRSLWSDRFTKMPIDEIWDRTTVQPLLDGTARLLSVEDTLLHLAIHRSRSPLRLRWVVDVAEAVHRHGPTIDWEVLVNRALRGGAGTATWVVLDLAWRLLDAPVPADPLHALRPARPHRFLLDRTCGATALFRPSEGLGQQSHLTLRVLEQDSARAIATTLVSSVRRSMRRVVHERGIRPVRSTGAGRND